MALSLQLLGPPLVSINGNTVSLCHRRAVLLLTLLALRAGRPLTRIAAAEAIWPQQDAEAASINLRRALADLRRMLETEAVRLVTPNRRELQLDTECGFTCDVLTFDAAVRRFQREGDRTVAAAAVALYRGPLLEGWTDDCLEAERRHRQDAVVTLLETLAREALNQGAVTEALAWCEQGLRVDPLRETLARLQIESYLRRDNRAAAETAFRGFSERMQRELGIAPGPLTHQAITAAPSRSPATPVPTPLPLIREPLIGREQELGSIVAQFAKDQAQTRLLTIVGPGGVGKTRLSIAAASRGEIVGSRRVVWVDLSRLPTQAAIATLYSTIAESLGAGGREPGQAPEQAIASALQEGAGWLLLLDNAEHVLPNLAFVVADLQRLAPEIRLLVTSRVPLHLPGERLLSLEPLGVPHTDNAETSENSPSVQLFLARARAVLPQFAFTGESAPAVARLCRRLDGLPLALELAAARLRTLPLAEMDRQMHQDRFPLPLLSGGGPTIPERHRALDETLAWSWHLLTAHQQCLLAQLEVFPGAFTLDAAHAVAGADTEENRLVTDLLELADQSLIQVVDAADTPRYRLLQTVRAYAALRLEAMPSELRAATRARLAAWAARFAGRAYDGLWKSDASHWSDRIAQDEENLYAGLESADAPTARRIVQGIEAFWWRKGRFQDGLRWQEKARRIAEEAGEHYEAAHLQLTEELFRRNLGQPHRARPAFTAFISLARARGNREVVIYLLHSLAFLECDEGDVNAAQASLEDGLQLAEQIAEETGEPSLQAYQWRGLAAVAIARERFAEAEQLCQQALEIFNARGNTVQETMTLPWLGRALLGSGDASGAYAVFARIAQLARQQSSLQLEQEAEQGLGDALLAMGKAGLAETHFERAAALAQTNGTWEGMAQAECGKSAALRATGKPSVQVSARILFHTAAPRLPYPTLVRVLTEAHAACAACGLPSAAVRLTEEITQARDAAVFPSSLWSPSLAVTRARAAYLPDQMTDILTHPSRP